MTQVFNMTFDTDSHTYIATDVGSVLWITGLSGVGKSTLAHALVAGLRRDGQLPLLLDGDEVRHALDPAHAQQHDVESRRARAWRLARLSRLAAAQGLPVVVATISLFHDVQRWNRQSNIPFAEVVLIAPLDLRRAHKTHVYGAVGSAQHREVVGVDQAAEFPLAPELCWTQTYSPADFNALLTETQRLWTRIQPAKIRHD
jgi:adenylylsulfate kinase-like enzyme